jgi:hypothetical protein
VGARTPQPATPHATASRQRTITPGNNGCRRRGRAESDPASAGAGSRGRAGELSGDAKVPVGSARVT